MGDDTSPTTAGSAAWPNSIAAAVLAGAVVGLLAAQIQSAGVFLVAIQSLAGGALLAVLLIGTTATLRAPRPRWAAALLAAAVAVATEHVRLYYLAMGVRRHEAATQPAVELFRPGWADQSLFDYLWAEATGAAVAWWLLDACLLTLAAVVIVEWSARQDAARAE